jgi:hypothetical protein
MSLEGIQGAFLRNRGSPLQRYASDAASICSGVTVESRISAGYSQYTYGAQSIIDLYLDSIRTTSPSPSIHSETLMDTPWEEAFQILSPQDQQSLHFIITSSKIDILSQIIGITHEKRVQYIAGEWGVGYGGTTVVIRDVVDRVIGWMDKFKNLGSILAPVDPVYATLPWAAFRFLLMVMGEDSARMGGVFVVLEDLIAILSRCEIYEGLYLKGIRFAPVYEHLEKALVVLYAAILAFLAKTKRFYETGIAGMILPQIYCA